jgi:hypothetical protein
MRSDRSFRRGDQVEATVVELVSQFEFIVRFDGGPDDPTARLLRLKNESHRDWRIGERVLLRVLQIAPLKFQLIEPLREQRLRGRLNFSI